MTNQDETFMLGRLISLLSKKDSLTLGEIKHNLRVFLKRKHQSDSNLFDVLQKFCATGHLKQIVVSGHIKFELQKATFDPGAITGNQRALFKADLIEQGLNTDEFESPIVKKARELAAKPLGQRGGL